MRTAIFLVSLTVSALLGYARPGTAGILTNDQCATPTVVTDLPFSETIVVNSASIGAMDPTSTCNCATQDDATIWYSVTPAANATISVDTIGSNYDTVVSVWTGTCAGLTEVDCSDDYSSPFGGVSRVVFEANAGTTYLIMVAGCGDAGAARVTIDVAPSKALGKTTSKCQQTVKKQASSFIGKALKGANGCTDKLFKCAQLKPTDFTCTQKACTGCFKTLDKVSALTEKINAKVAGKCAESLVPFTRVTETSGLGYEQLGDTCNEEYTSPFDDLDSLILCVDTQHACQVGVLAGNAMPRSRQLIGQCGFVPPQLCLPNRGGSGFLPNEDDAKGIVKCQSKAKAAATKLVTQTLKSLEKCVDAIFNCVQSSPTDGTCISTEEGDGKAQKKCDKEFLKMEAAAAKVAPVLEKACGELPPSALFDANGANLTSLVTECDNVGVTLTDLASFSECLVRHQVCEAEELMQFQAPTGEALLRLVDQNLFSDFCD